jgi:hypothetical protein
MLLQNTSAQSHTHSGAVVTDACTGGFTDSISIQQQNPNTTLFYPVFLLLFLLFRNVLTAPTDTSPYRSGRQRMMRRGVRHQVLLTECESPAAKCGASHQMRVFAEDVIISSQSQSVLSLCLTVTVRDVSSSRHMILIMV